MLEVVAAKVGLSLAKYGDTKNQEALLATINAITPVVSSCSAETIKKFSDKLQDTGTIVDLYFSTIKDIAAKAVKGDSAGDWSIDAISSAISSLPMDKQILAKAAIYKRFGNTAKANKWNNKAKAIDENRKALIANIENTSSIAEGKGPKDGQRVPTQYLVAGAAALVLLIFIGAARK